MQSATSAYFDEKVRRNNVINNNKIISKKYTSEWAKSCTSNLTRWKTEGLNKKQKETVEQIKKDIYRIRNNPPLIYALIKIAEEHPGNYSYGQDDVIYLEWLLQHGLIDLSSNSWMNEILPEFAMLWSVKETAAIRKDIAELAYKYINEKTIKNLVNNLQIYESERGKWLKGYLSQVYDQHNADKNVVYMHLSNIIQNWPLLTKCANSVLSNVFIYKRKITSEILLGYILDVLRTAGQSQQKKKKLKK